MQSNPLLHLLQNLSQYFIVVLDGTNNRSTARDNLHLNGKFLELLPTLRVPGAIEIVAEKLR